MTKAKVWDEPGGFNPHRQRQNRRGQAYICPLLRANGAPVTDPAPIVRGQAFVKGGGAISVLVLRCQASGAELGAGFAGDVCCSSWSKTCALRDGLDAAKGDGVYSRGRR